MTRLTRHTRRRVAVVALGLGPALTACGASLSCTAVGCVSVVSVDIASLATKARPLSATATLCAAGACQTQKVSFIADANDRAWDSPSGAAPALPGTRRLTAT